MTTAGVIGRRPRRITARSRARSSPKSKRLDQTVVGAAVRARDSGIHGIPGRQHEDGHIGSVASNLAAVGRCGPSMPSPLHFTTHIFRATPLVRLAGLWLLNPLGSPNSTYLSSERVNRTYIALREWRSARWKALLVPPAHATSLCIAVLDSTALVRPRSRSDASFGNRRLDGPVHCG